MAASKEPIVPFTIKQGATFRKRVTWQTGNPVVGVDLTGYTAQSQIRADIDAPDALATMTTENGGLTLDANGNIDFYLPHTTTKLFTEGGTYDIEFIAPNGDVLRPFGGPVTVLPEVTRV